MSVYANVNRNETLDKTEILTNKLFCEREYKIKVFEYSQSPMTGGKLAKLA